MIFGKKLEICLIWPDIPPGGVERPKLKKNNVFKVREDLLKHLCPFLVH